MGQNAERPDGTVQRPAEAGDHDGDVNLVRIRYFLAVAEMGTVTAAAARLRVAQPAVSRQLQHLERDLGVRLFDRAGRRLGLTAAGRAFAELGGELLVQAQHFGRATRELADGVVHHLVLAAPETSIVEIVAPFLATLLPGDPLIRVHRDAPRQMHAALRYGADLVISTEPPLRSLATRPLADVPLRAYVATTHEWARASRETVTLADLAAEPLLLLPRDYMTRMILDQAITRARLSYRHVEECSVSRVIQALAAAGFGVAVLTERPWFDVHPVLITESAGSDVPLLLHLHAAWNRGHYAAPVIEDLVHRMAAYASGSAASPC
jgi:DNA-binding transcriptional LysR family regulator